MVKWLNGKIANISTRQAPSSMLIANCQLFLACGIWHLLLSIRHQVIENPASGIGHPVTEIQH